MTSELAICDKQWLSLRGAESLIAKQFENKIELGVFKVLGVESVDDLGVKLRDVNKGDMLSLIVEGESVLVCNDKEELGLLRKSEGSIIRQLLNGGKSVVAYLYEKDLQGLLPSLNVRIVMEDF